MASPRCLLLGCVLFLLARVPLAHAGEAKALELRLVPIDQGNRASAFGGQPEKFRQTPVFKAAQAAGIDIAKPDHPLVICSLKNHRVFFLFYNLIVNVPPSADDPAEPYLIQRIKRTRIDYSPNGESSSKVDYLVEAMKTRGGTMKRPDQHFGSYGLGLSEKRKIVKEVEIGIGQIEGIAVGGPWPFAAGILFKSIQGYQDPPGAYAKCRFTQSLKWTFSVEFDRQGNYELKSSELGIELVRRVPAVFANLEPPRRSEPAKPQEIDPSSKDVILEEGQGVFGLEVGKSRLEDIEKKLGEPLKSVRASAKATNYDFAKGLSFNITNDGKINTIFTRPEFGGKTSKGIRHGDPREKVIEAYGKQGNRSTPAFLAREGIIFWFDGENRISKIVIVSAPPKRRPIEARD